MPNSVPGYDEILIPDHYVEHNGHIDFHPSHTAYVKSGEMATPPNFPPSKPAPDGYSWIGIPSHYDYHNGHYDYEEGHWALAQEHSHGH